METRENDLAHSLLMEIRVFAKLCISFALLGLILACSAGVFFGCMNVFAQKSTMLKLLKRGGNGVGPKGYNFYSSQSSSVIKSKMADTTTLTFNKLLPTQNMPALQASLIPK